MEWMVIMCMIGLGTDEKEANIWEPIAKWLKRRGKCQSDMLSFVCGGIENDRHIICCTYYTDNWEKLMNISKQLK